MSGARRRAGVGCAIGAALLVVWGPCTGARDKGCGAIPESAPIVDVGAFSNMEFTEEHAYGYSVMLWRAGSCAFGLLRSAQGLAGDTPSGALEDVELDAGTGRLTFSARLTTGLVGFKGSPEPTPARDLFKFDGKIQATSLTGVMTHTIVNVPNFKPERAEVELKSSPEDAETMRGPKTYGAWAREWTPVLKRLGPKW